MRCVSTAVVIVLALAAVARAQGPPYAVSTQPFAPTSITPVTLVVSNACCPVLLDTFTRTGFTIDIQSGAICLSPCIPHSGSYDLGLLPPGTYTVRLVVEESSAAPQVIGTFAVSEAVAPIPALDFAGKMAAALSLALLAVIGLRRFI